MEKLVCDHCSMVFKNKTTLKYHTTNSKKCMKLRGVKLESRYQCKGCNEFFVNKVNLHTHIESCKKYCILQVTTDLQNTIDKFTLRENQLLSEIDAISSKNKELYNQKDILEKNEISLLLQQKTYEKSLVDANLQIDKLQKMLGDIASKAVDKPTITVTNQVRNCFSATQFLEDIKPADVKRKCQTNLTEKILMEGQRGIARLCTEQFINTNDKKKLLISTDHSRAKFRYMDKNGNIKDDIEARTFIEKVSKPIKEVADIVFDNVLSCIKDEKETLEEDDYGRKSELNNKELQANMSMMYIKCFDDPDHNSDFTNELSILNQIR